MSKSRLIPEELIRIKAHQIYKERQREGRNETPESDWEEAKKYLKKHWWKIVLWRLGKTLNKLRKSIGRVVKHLWKLLIFPFKLLWRVLFFPFWLLWIIPSLFAEPQSRDFALEVIKTLGIGLTAFGLLFSVWEGLEDRRLTQERLVTERFSKAVEQLGKYKDREGKNPDTTVRIGGIYALERIAKDYDQDHWTIMEVLTSYVREKSTITEELEDTNKKIQDLINSYEKEEIDYTELKRREQELIEPLKVSIDVQAVLTVIGRREDPQPDRDEKIDLSSTNLYRSYLIGANLYRANLRSAYLRDANLYRAYLGDADLYRANLYRAYLRDANLYRAYLGDADLYRANLIGANLNNAYLIGANLRDAYLGKANLIGANLNNANLYRADLTGANLIGADLYRANLSSADLYRANLIGARSLRSNKIKSTCYWEQATYKQDKEQNKKYIEELKKDKSSDPEEKPDCSRWEI